MECCSSTMIDYPEIRLQMSDRTKDDLRQFAQQFRLRRIQLGVTQAEVGAAMVDLRPSSTPLSQSTICRFESMTLSCSNMQALRPVLEAWLTAAEHRRITEMDECDVTERRLWPATAGRRRRRTTITSPVRSSLEACFAIDARPSSQQITNIANKLCLKKSVVCVWYCNQRQKQKRLKN